MSYQGNYGDGQPPQYSQGYGRQYPQDEPRQPQDYDPFAHNQNLGGLQYQQQAPPWDASQGSQRQPYSDQHPPQASSTPGMLSHGSCRTTASGSPTASRTLRRTSSTLRKFRRGSSHPSCRSSPSRSGDPGPPGTRCSPG